MNTINRLAMTNTTAQIIAYYRKNNLNILEDIEGCTIGLKMAIEQVLSKTAVKIRHETHDRVEVVDADIIQELRGDNQ